MLSSFATMISVNMHSQKYTICFGYQKLRLFSNPKELLCNTFFNSFLLWHVFLFKKLFNQKLFSFIKKILWNLVLWTEFPNMRRLKIAFSLSRSISNYQNIIFVCINSTLKENEKKKFRIFEVVKMVLPPLIYVFCIRLKYLFWFLNGCDSLLLIFCAIPFYKISVLNQTN